MVTTNINASQDSYISYSSPDSNYYLEEDFFVSTRNTANQSYDIDCCALFKYDISGIVEPTITSAILHVYGGGSTIQAPAVKIYSLPFNDWEESTVTWNTAPVYGSHIGNLNVFRKSIGTLAHELGNDGNNWQTVDLTTYTNTQFNTTDYVHIALKPSPSYPMLTIFKGILSGALQTYLTIISV